MFILFFFHVNAQNLHLGIATKEWSISPLNFFFNDFVGTLLDSIAVPLANSIYLVLAFQVSEVYQTMKIDSLCKMIPFVEFSFLEKISMDAVKYNFLSMKIDHIKNAVIFSSMVS